MNRVTVYLRFPFDRNGFTDPANSLWNTDKETALWEVLSRVTNRETIDWSLLAEKLEVSVPFVLQQAALLYEKELQRVRLQMTKVRKSDSRSPARAPEKSANTKSENHTSTEPTSATAVYRSNSNSNSATGSDNLYMRSPGSSQSHSGSLDKSRNTGRRLISQSRLFMTETEDPVVLSGGLHRFESSSNANTGDSTHSTDISQGSISKSALEEVMNELSSSTSRSSRADLG